MTKFEKKGHTKESKLVRKILTYCTKFEKTVGFHIYLKATGSDYLGSAVEKANAKYLIENSQASNYMGDFGAFFVGFKAQNLFQMELGHLENLADLLKDAMEDPVLDDDLLTKIETEDKEKCFAELEPSDLAEMIESGYKDLKWGKDVLQSILEEKGFTRLTDYCTINESEILNELHLHDSGNGDFYIEYSGSYDFCIVTRKFVFSELKPKFNGYRLIKGENLKGEKIETWTK